MSEYGIEVDGKNIFENKGLVFKEQIDVIQGKSYRIDIKNKMYSIFSYFESRIFSVFHDRRNKIPHHKFYVKNSILYVDWVNEDVKIDVRISSICIWGYGD
ncbi:hypothetical protein [Gallibacterium anatis]|uniref:hypothetical protein n=1 Tax=Gallibacterium anatis TaxID=750 RepID=UPI0005318E45|nr:hypothetical protein [Gallibacterium anatis]KGQ66211.1 hypothetical protein IO49_06190 [Gallibacterium anatis]